MNKNVKFKFNRSSCPVKERPTQIANNHTGDIRYDYEVIEFKKFDRDKSYYSVFFKSVILFTDYNAKSYNILNRYDDNTGERHYYICLYKNIEDNAVPLVRDYTGGYKIHTYNIFYYLKQDTNIDIKLIEERNNPDCVIYQIR